MPEFNNENRGALFRNDRKEPNTNSPDYRGTLNVRGREFYLSAWLKEAHSGQKFLSIAVKPKTESIADKKPATAKRDDFVNF